MKEEFIRKLKKDRMLNGYLIYESFMENRILLCKDDNYEHSVQILVNNEDRVTKDNFENDNKIGVFARFNTWNDEDNVDLIVLSSVYQLLLAQEIYELSKTNIVTFEEDDDYYLNNFIGVIISKDNNNIIKIIKHMLEFLEKFSQESINGLSVAESLLNDGDQKIKFIHGLTNFPDMARVIKEYCDDLINMNSDDYLIAERTCKSIINIINDIKIKD